MRNGKPEWVTTDNGTDFAGAFRHHLERFGIDHLQTSAYHPQSNGAVKRLVRTMKDMLTAKLLVPPMTGLHCYRSYAWSTCNVSIRSWDAHPVSWCTRICCD